MVDKTSDMRKSRDREVEVLDGHLPDTEGPKINNKSSGEVGKNQVLKSSVNERTVRSRTPGIRGSNE